MSVPTEPEFDWGVITGQAVERLRAPKVASVPASIVELAQRSYVGVVNEADPEGARLHVLRHQFDSASRAEQFVKLMRKAGDHTSPRTSVSVVVDPDRIGAEAGGDRIVAWRAGERRGKKAASVESY